MPDIGTMSLGVNANGQTTLEPLNDSYMSLTQTAGTEITRLVWPRKNCWSKVGFALYTAGATAHTLSFCPTVGDELFCTEKAESGQAVLKVNKLNTDPSGGAVANTDWFSVQHEDGTYGEYKVSSVSGFAITFTGNLSKDVLTKARVFYHAAPADHATNRAFLTTASVDNTLPGDGQRAQACISTQKDHPILVVSNNATNAGNLRMLSFSYGNDG
jgi:hypothetical protein